mgnify:CR=1 FL=1
MFDRRNGLSGLPCLPGVPFAALVLALGASFGGSGPALAEAGAGTQLTGSAYQVAQYSNTVLELQRELNIPIPSHGYLQRWAELGVLLLNTTMTVERANAASHAKKGWELFTDRIIQVVSEQCPNVVFLLWGAHAQSKQKLIDGTKHLVLKSVHPSPLSAYRGFIGCGHFSRTNSFLEQRGLGPIDWALPPL